MKNSLELSAGRSLKWFLYEEAKRIENHCSNNPLSLLIVFCKHIFSSCLPAKKIKNRIEAKHWASLVTVIVIHGYIGQQTEKKKALPCHWDVFPIALYLLCIKFCTVFMVSLSTI